MSGKKELKQDWPLTSTYVTKLLAQTAGPSKLELELMKVNQICLYKYNIYQLELPIYPAPNAYLLHNQELSECGST